jgi:hypothetical protein
MTNATFAIWLNKLLDEKSFDTEMTFDVEGPSGVNMMSYDVVLNAIMGASLEEKAGIKNVLVQIDFKNGDIGHYFRHLAQALAI